MAKKGNTVLFLCFIVTISTFVTFHFPAATQLRQPAQTEIVLENRTINEPQPETKKPRVVKRYNILRWHNHTINLHLRNVRSRWLTFTVPAQRQPITFPDEDSRI